MLSSQSTYTQSSSNNNNNNNNNNKSIVGILCLVELLFNLYVLF